MESGIFSKKRKPVIVLLCPGIGLAPDYLGNVMNQAKLPFLRSLVSEYPAFCLKAGEVPVLDSRLAYFRLGCGFREKKPNAASVADLPYGESSLIADSETFFGAYDFFGGRDEKMPRLREIVNYESLNFRDYSDKSAINFKKAIKALKGQKEGVIYVFNGLIDLSAKSGDVLMVKAALEWLDTWLKKLCKNVLAAEASLVMVSPYGRVEEMIDPLTEKIKISITANPVPFLAVNEDLSGISLFGEGGSGDLNYLPVAGELIDFPAIMAFLLGVEAVKIGEGHHPFAPK